MGALNACLTQDLLLPMTTRLLFILGACVFLEVVSSAAWADTKPAAKGGEAGKGAVVFSFFPKSFQKNPQLDFNVLTEMTAEGKKRTPPTAAAPAYYMVNVDPAESRGFVTLDMAKNAPKPEQVEHLVAQALSTNHYLPATKGGPAPSVVILVHWGAYSSPAFNGEEAANGLDQDQPGKSAKELLPYVLGSVQKRKAIIERASLIGGAKFGVELNDVLNQEVHLRSSADSAEGARSAAAGPDGSAVGNSLMSILEASSPLALFMSRDIKTERMVEEVFSDSYYVVVSAVDLKSVADHKPILLWRTKLSLNSIGVSLAETVSPMINAGTDYFGKETDKAVLVTKRLDRSGRVDIGEAKTVEYLEPDKKAPAPSDHPAPNEKR